MFDSLVGLAITAALLLGSPGPAPLTLAACGASFGVRTSLPFLIGILLGLSVVIVGASLGVTVLFEAFPTIRLGVQLCGAAYIVYIAVKIATAPVLKANELESAKAKIPSLIDGFIFNLLNPKAYAVLLAIFSQLQLPLDSAAINFIVMAAVCLLVAAVVDFIWLLLGQILRSLLEGPRTARLIRVSFAFLMVMAVGISVWG